MNRRPKVKTTIVNASEKNSRNDYRSMSEDRGTGNKDVKGLRTDVSGVSRQWVERLNFVLNINRPMPIRSIVLFAMKPQKNAN
ncbi:hypothetical protein DAPPUDRAFT_239042 [Daphnia pulex]|uniref:Uncharacterized protein n=1 Tax=Daphnia pulex TaxID=6669 RepID=E9G864_DAPPU|nr:hypothetical protein DAPPUDRAFT_239042 [Daphnia pulex]|eukprot:EFX83925.1 hypothetical protein DAPPUDRAFT_239042 [Daphnia pulex]